MNNGIPEGSPTLPLTAEPPSLIPAEGFTGENKNLTRRVASGAVWSAVARACLQLLYFVNVAVLARKLSPESYGLMNMTQIAVGLVSLFRDIGIGSAVIQKRDIDRNFLTSLSWMATGLGCVATLACIAMAPLAAAFYHQPLVAPMLRVLSLSFAISSFTTVHEALLNREMAFSRIALVEIGAALASVIVAILFACAGQGVWSLVAASLTTSVASTIGFLVSCRWLPSFEFSWKHVRSVTRFGMSLSGFNLFNYFARNADNVLVGRYLGTAALGFYQFAYMTMLYPVQNVAQLLGRVLFPAFSEIQHDRPRLCAAYIRSCAIIALISFPLLAGLAAVARPFVLVWMGSTWLPVATLIAILAPVGIFQAIGTTTGQIFMATGRTDVMFKWGLFASPLTVLSFVAGLRWGVKGVAISYAMVMVLMAYPLFRIPARLIDLSLMDLWRAVQPVALATACMFLAVLSLEWFVRWTTPVGTLAICIPAGVLVYAASLRVFAPALLRDVLTVGRTIYRKRA